MQEIIYNHNNLTDIDMDSSVIRTKALIINSKSEILLGYSYQTYQFPGGHLQEGENIFECLQREIEEETGIFISGKLDPFLKRVEYHMNYLNSNFNKKVIIYSQGIGPITNKFAQIIVKNLLKKCDLVTVRDEKSLFLLNKWGIDAKLVCDPIYSVKITQNEKTNSVGIQLRDFKTMNENLLQKLALLIITKFSDKKVEIFSLQEALDLAVCRRFENILKSFNSEIETEIITDDIVNRISKLEYFIAMRFHAILCALKCGVKTCAINYDIKVEKLAQDASIPLISMSAEENFERIFESMQKLNNDELMSFANSKNFDWSEFDELFISK